MLEKEPNKPGASAPADTVSTSNPEDTNMQDSRLEQTDIPSSDDEREVHHAEATGAPASAISGQPQNLGLPSTVLGSSEDEDALADLEAGVSKVATPARSNADAPLADSPREKAVASPKVEAAAPTIARIPEDVEPVIYSDPTKGKEEARDDRIERTITKVGPRGTPQKEMRKPVFSAATAAVRPAADAKIADPTDDIRAELTKVVSIPFRNKDDPSRPEHLRPLKYFETFKFDEAAGKKLLGLMAKLGIKDLIKAEPNEVLKIMGDDSTRVVVLSGNTLKSTFYQIPGDDGEVKCTKDFGYLTVEERFRTKPDIKRNLIDANGRSIMHYAMLSGRLPMIRVVSEVCEANAKEQFAEKVSINKTDKLGYSAVHYACMVGNFYELEHVKEVRDLKWISYDKKAKQDKETKKPTTVNKITGLTPVNPNAHDGIISFMNRHGADYGSRSIYGETPLHCAILNNSVELIPTLVECSAQVVNKNDIENGIQGKKITKGMSIVHYAAMHPQVTAETLNTIITKCYDQPLKSEDAAIYGCVNLKDEHGNTPLHYAAATGNLQAMLVLIQHGANANLTNNDGNTALDIAAQVKLEGGKNNTFTLKYSTAVPAVQTTLSRFGGDVAKQRTITQETINEFKAFVASEILQGRLYDKLAQVLDDIFPLWYELRQATEDQRNPKNVQPGRIYLTPIGTYLLRNPQNEVVEGNIFEDDEPVEFNLDESIRSLTFKNRLLALTTERGHTLAEQPKTLKTQAQCFVDAGLFLLMICGDATPKLNSAPLRPTKIVECVAKEKQVTDPNFTKGFDRSKAQAYGFLIYGASRKPGELVLEDNISNERAVQSAHSLCHNYYSRGRDNKYWDRFLAWIAHPGRGHHEVIKDFERKLDELPGDKEAQTNAGTNALHQISKAIINNSSRFRRATDSSAMSRIGVARELISRSYVNGHDKSSVPDLGSVDDRRADDFDFAGGDNNNNI